MKNNKAKNTSIIKYLFSLPNILAISLGIFLLAIFKIVEKTINTELVFVKNLKEYVNISHDNSTTFFLDFQTNITNTTEIFAELIVIVLIIIFALSQWSNAQQKKLTWWSSIIVLAIFLWLMFVVVPYTEFFVDY